METLKTNNFWLMRGDCLDKMSKIPDESVDLILTDLPYGTTKVKWDSVIDIEKLWIQYKRIIKKPTGVIVLFGKQPFTARVISANFEWFKYCWIWKKDRTTKFLLANYRPMTNTEDIMVFSPGGAAAASKETGNMTYNPQGLIKKVVNKKNNENRLGKMLNQKHHLGENNKLYSDKSYKQHFTNYPTEILEFKTQDDMVHETQKPVDLLEYLVRTYSNEKDVVLDSTMGSGTTGVACMNTNRQFIGIELNKEYFGISRDRIKKAMASSRKLSKMVQKESKV